MRYGLLVPDAMLDHYQLNYWEQTWYQICLMITVFQVCENVVCKMTAILFRLHYINLSPPSATYMRQRIEPALVQIMACRLFGAKPLFKQMLGYCQLDL